MDTSQKRTILCSSQPTEFEGTIVELSIQNLNSSAILRSSYLKNLSITINFVSQPKANANSKFTYLLSQSKYRTQPQRYRY
jgi:hypothetical protein